MFLSQEEVVSFSPLLTCLTNRSLAWLQTQVIDDRARDQRLVALLEKYHKSQK